MATRGQLETFQGRRADREVLHRLLGPVRGGQSGVLAESGDPAVGKTGLIASAITSASGSG